MGEWRQGLNIDLGATKQRTVLFNLKQVLFNLSIFSQFYFIPGEQMSTLWANGQGLKIELGMESSGQYSLTSHKMFTQPLHPLQEKIR